MPAAQRVQETVDLTTGERGKKGRAPNQKRNSGIYAKIAQGVVVYKGYTWNTQQCHITIKELRQA